ncbi:S8 family peptidase [Luteitalea sp.]|uniref:S8 family serine peptidase n=1 Tax=Luteitalea sp. TaxID=2004800 RepID=UPI0025BC7C70|nr:S8 family peptidase [Luteitalea sp.]
MSVGSKSQRPLLAVCLGAVAAFVLTWPVALGTRQLPEAPQVVQLASGPMAVDGEVLVKYRGDAMHVARVRVQDDAEVAEEESLGRGGVRRLRSGRFGTEELVARLRDDPDIEFVEPNYIVYPDATPNDPSFSSLWGLLNTGSNPVGGGGTAGIDIDVVTAWDTTTGSRSHVVGVVDTGVDYNHPDLAANMWSAPSSFSVVIGGQSITCAAGTHGFDAINRTCTPMDSGYHGTHVAGTIGAVGNNGIGVTGVNWVASMMALKFSLPNGGTVANAINAIEFAIQAKAHFAGTGAANVRVLNNSWGGPGYSSALAAAIESARTADMLFVAAAGNSTLNIDASPVYPAAYTNANMVTVASTTSTDGLSSFSNYGATKVHLAAPGSAIYSTYPNNTYQTLQGTSMAAPHVAGAAALVLASCTSDTAALRSLLVSHVDYVAGLSGKVSTGGRLNVLRSMQQCGFPRVTGLTLTPDVASPRAPGTTITWTAAASGGEAPHQYQFALFNGSTWTDVGPWSTTATFAWTPTQASSGYQVAVRARSDWNSGTRELAVAQPYVIQPVVTALTLTPQVASPQAVGRTVTWTAAASGGQAPYQYQFVLFNGTSWADVGPWSTSNTWAWTPGTANANYQVAVRARSAWNSGARELAVAEAYVIKPSVTGLTLTPSVTAPRAPNTTVTWTAVASGGEAPYEYQFAVFDGAVWTDAGAWSTTNTWNWTPTQANVDYQVAVRARSAWNSGTRERAVAQPFAIRPLVTGLSLTPTVAAPQGAGTTVTWTAAASGGLAPYQYQFAIFNGTTWVDAGPWSTTATYAWTPSVANAAYQIAVRARSAGNLGTRELAVAQAYAIKPIVTGLTLTPSVAAPRAPGTTVTWTASASGGEGPYQYQFAIFNGTTWSDAGAWSSTATFAWTPTQANAAYQVAVRARGAWNSGARERAVAQPFAVMPLVTAITLSPSAAAPSTVGTPITWTAAASGGQGPYSYQFAFFNGVTWQDLTSWSTSATFTWTPTQVNSAYQMAVRAKGTWNPGARELAVATAHPVSP